MLAVLKRMDGRLRTVLVRQGHYGEPGTGGATPAPDLVVDRIEDILEVDVAAMVEAHLAAAFTSALGAQVPIGRNQGRQGRRTASHGSGLLTTAAGKAAAREQAARPGDRTARGHGGWRRVLGLTVLFVLAVACGSQGNGGSGRVRFLGAWEGAPSSTRSSRSLPPSSRKPASRSSTPRRATCGDHRGRARARIPTGRSRACGTGPHPGALADAGALRDLAPVIDLQAYKQEVAPTFIELGTVDGRLVGAFGKSTLKGLVWFLSEPATRRSALVRQAARDGPARDGKPHPGVVRRARIAGVFGMAGGRLDRAIPSSTGGGEPGSWVASGWAGRRSPVPGTPSNPSGRSWAKIPYSQRAPR